MYLRFGSQGQGTSAWPSASGIPTEWTHGTKGRSVPSSSRAPCPIRVMIRIDAAT